MQNYFDLIDDYLEGTLSPEQHVGFESQLLSDKNLLIAFEEKQLMRAHLRRVRLHRLINDATANMPLPEVKPSMPYQWLFVGGGIMLFSLTLGYFIWKNDDIPTNTPTQIINESPQNKQQPVIIDDARAGVPTEKSREKEESKTTITTEVASTTAATTNSKRLDSLDFYIADAPIGYNDWSKNESEWRGVDDAENQRLYFEAYKNLKNNNVTIAENSFRQLSQNKRFKNYRRAQWYLTLCELSKNPTPNNSTLVNIINTDGHFFQSKAMKLQKYLLKN